MAKMTINNLLTVLETGIYKHLKNWKQMRSIIIQKYFL